MPIYYSIFLSLLLLFTSCGTTRRAEQQPTTNSSLNANYVKYIDTYKDIAIEQQQKFKIPASITLAQGLLESGAGSGTLARKSNNHFGIKCHDWTGARTYHDDDEKGECFRKYDHPRQSYEDHSRFLVGRSRYESLFKLKITDYKGWAHGLRACGYATDKEYGNKLIRLIESYNLDQYDNAKVSRTSSYPTVESSVQGMHTLYKSLGLIYIEAKEGDQLSEISKEFDIAEKWLRSYNDLPKGYVLKAGDIVYLEQKFRRAPKPYETHTVGAGDSMHAISQRYAIRMKVLYKLNDKGYDYRPQSGDVLKLQ